MKTKILQRSTPRISGRMIPKLSQLILYPDGGICNRLRAIGSARRLCRQLNARCSIVWDWGVFDDYFVNPGGIELIKEASVEPDGWMQHAPMNIDSTRTVDVMVRTLALISGYVFWGSHEAKIELTDVSPHIPKLAPRIEERVNAFSRTNFRNTVGFHMRRTDNRKCILNSPDELFIEKGHTIVAAGQNIFLATDNIATETKMKRIFGTKIITYPKRQSLWQRWPREFDPVAMEDDLVDLFLLTRTQYVVGSYWSSYSGFAMLLNGSKKSVKLKVE